MAVALSRSSPIASPRAWQHFCRQRSPSFHMQRKVLVLETALAWDRLSQHHIDTWPRSGLEGSELSPTGTRESLPWSSARGKALLQPPALQLSSPRAGISMALQRKQPDSSLCSARKSEWCRLCSGGSQAALPGASEASQLGRVYLVQCSLLFFLCLDKSPVTALPGQVRYWGLGPGAQSCTSIKEFLRPASLHGDGESRHLDRH